MMKPIASDRYESVGALLRDALVQFKTHTALIEVDRKKEKASYTYLEFKQAAEQLARRLQDAGVGAGDLVAICMSNQSKWLLSAYAAFFRGAVLVPIDYKLTAKEQASILAHCKPKLLITEYPLWRRFCSLKDGAEGFSSLWVTECPSEKSLSAELEDAAAFNEVEVAVERWEDIPSNAAPPDFVERKRQDQATLVYSSGTGGDPKGCMLTHDNYLEQYNALIQMYPLVSGDRYFSILPTNHAIDFMVGFLGPFLGGATVVHQRTLRPEFLLDTMQRYKITHMAIVPLILEAFERKISENLSKQEGLRKILVNALIGINRACTKKKPRPKLSRKLLKPIHDAFGGELKVLFCGGAFVPEARAQFFYDLGIPVIIGYGLTEASTVATLCEKAPFRADSVGKPISGVKLEVRSPDEETGIGEVWLKSRMVMKGYLNDLEQTEETIQNGWLKTGDLGFLDDTGHLHLVGRTKNMIVTPGGKNIYPEDIEAAFLGLPCEEFVVFASGYLFSSEKLTEEKLVIVVREPGEGFQEALQKQNRRLADFKRVQSVLEWKEAFPRTASMKIKRAQLAEEIRIYSASTVNGSKSYVLSPSSKY